MRIAAKSVWDNPWFMIPVLLALNVGLVAAYFLPYGAEILELNPVRREPLNTIFKTGTHLGEAYGFIIAALLALFWRYRNAVIVGLTGVIILPVIYFLKDLIGTSRPITWLDRQGLLEELVRVPGVELASGQTSFPSGHTIAAFTLFSVLTMALPDQHRRWGLAFALLAILVAVSRVFLAQHFLMDILGGSVIGLLLGWCCGNLDQVIKVLRSSALNGSFRRYFN